MALIESEFTERPLPLVVDLWFTDASWKLGLLLLDVEDYSGALEQLIRVYHAPLPNDSFREQLFAYMAEAFYGVNDKDAARWFVDRTLDLNPANTYVLQFR